MRNNGMTTMIFDIFWGILNLSIHNFHFLLFLGDDFTSEKSAVVLCVGNRGIFDGIGSASS